MATLTNSSPNESCCDEDRRQAPASAPSLSLSLQDEGDSIPLFGRQKSSRYNWNNKQVKNSGNGSGNNHDIRGVIELGRVRGENDSASGPDFELLPNFQVTK